MNVDRIHTWLTITALALLALGSASAWGIGYGAMLIGALLLTAVVYARTRDDGPPPPTTPTPRAGL